MYDISLYRKFTEMEEKICHFLAGFAIRAFVGGDAYIAPQKRFQKGRCGHRPLRGLFLEMLSHFLPGHFHFLPQFPGGHPQNTAAETT